MKYATTLFLLTLFSGICSAGCMSGKINAVNEQLKMTSVTDDVKAEIIKLRDLGIENEHSNAKLAVKYFDEAMALMK
ncbi:MAG: hypothetical protein VX086_00185 [Pseudomonadota bacterium]|nr:hypothetical protein [Pseudomonadota bacterium]